MVFNFSKKDSMTGFALIRNLKNGVWLSCFAAGVLLFWELQEKIIESPFIANLQAFLVKLHIIELRCNIIVVISITFTT